MAAGEHGGGDEERCRGEREWREADMWVPHTSGATQASLARHVGLMGGVCTRLDLYDTRDKFGCPEMHFGSSGT